MTQCAFAMPTLEEAFPNSCGPIRPPASGRAAPARRLRQGAPRRAHAQPRQRLHRRGRGRFSGARTRFFKQDEGLEIAFTAEPKIDGLSASLLYEDGVFVQRCHPRRRHGRRRHHGEPQDHRRHSAQAQGSGWPKSIEIRGEVYMTYAEFQASRSARPPPAGRITSIRATPPPARCARRTRLVTASRNLRFFAYAWGATSEDPAPTQFEAVQKFGELGLCHQPAHAARQDRSKS